MAIPMGVLRETRIIGCRYLLGVQIQHRVVRGRSWIAGPMPPPMSTLSNYSTNYPSKLGMTTNYPFLAPPRQLSALLLAAVLAAPTSATYAAGPTTPIAVPDAPYRAPYVPTQDDEILQQVPAASDPAVREMAILRAELNVNPNNL